MSPRVAPRPTTLPADPGTAVGLEPARTHLADREDTHGDSHPGSRSESELSAAELLSAPSPSAVLERIADGDPLALYDRALAAIRRRAVLVSIDRVFQRALARTAHAAARYAGEPLDPWLEERVADSLADLLDEDREDERSGLPPGEPWDPRYAFLSEALGIEPGLARRACIVFNDLPDPERTAFYRIVVEGLPVNRFVAQGNGPPQRVHALLKRAFLALSLLSSPDDAGDDIAEGLDDA